VRVLSGPSCGVETGAAGKPAGIDWSRLSAGDVAEMPVLERFEE